MYVFCCAAAGSDGRIRLDTLNACTRLLLVLPSNTCASGVWLLVIVTNRHPAAWSVQRQPLEAKWQQPTVVQRRLQPPSADTSTSVASHG